MNVQHFDNATLDYLLSQINPRALTAIRTCPEGWFWRAGNISDALSAMIWVRTYPGLYEVQTVALTREYQRYDVAIPKPVYFAKAKRVEYRLSPLGYVLRYRASGMDKDQAMSKMNAQLRAAALRKDNPNNLTFAVVQFGAEWRVVGTDADGNVVVTEE